MHRTTSTIEGVRIDVSRVGTGRPILFLHGPWGVTPDEAFLESIGAIGAVAAPWHPGFGHSELPAGLRSVNDLALFYLDFLEAEDLHDVVVIGSSFGGWIAAEVAVRSVQRIDRMVLISPVGIKVGGRESRDVADVFAMSQDELISASFHDTASRLADYSEMSDTELVGVARSREAYAYFTWRPYMHNPSLRRWLHRACRPTLVIGGTSDRVLSDGYLNAFAASLPDARLVMVPAAGHYPHIEQTKAVVSLVRDFIEPGPV